MTSRTVFVCLVMCILAVVMHTAVSVPPDFFRNGRGMPIRIPTQKKSSAELDLLSSACDYCGRYDPSLGFECRRSIGISRKVCVLQFLEELEDVVSNNGWKA